MTATVRSYKNGELVKEVTYSDDEIKKLKGGVDATELEVEEDKALPKEDKKPKKTTKRSTRK